MSARVYRLEAKYELIKMLRLPAFVVPTIGFPLMFYTLFGLVMSSGKPQAAQASSYLLATYGAFGVIGISLFALGVVLLLVSPVVGVIPGPGGIVVAGIGLALILKTSMWAKRHYVRVKRWQPKAGRWMDWALRRPSAQRREQIRKAERN